MQHKKGEPMKLNGLPIVNARRPIRIRVTQADIDGGYSKKPGKCAAARACVRQLKGVQEAFIHVGRSYLRFGNKWRRFLTSKPLRTEVAAYDKGGKFEPGFYLLSRMPKHTLTGKGTGSSTSRNKPRRLQKKRAPYHVVKNVRHIGAASGELFT